MPYEGLREELARLDAAGLLRRRRVIDSPQGPRVRVEGRELLAFASNDYLGLASHPALMQAAAEGAARFGVGAGAAHLVAGHFQSHELLEQALADFVGQPAALLFSTGYMANLGAVQALVGRGDAVFSDQLNHASLNDGARLSGALSHRYRHGDLEHLATLLQTAPARRRLILSDGVFSMDGDIAPLPELLELCERYDAWLLLDDAHGFGVLGSEGRGTPSHFRRTSPRLIYMGTLGKAAGVAGAFVAGPAEVVEILLQRAHTYVFTTAAPAFLSCALLESLRLIRQESWRRDRLLRLVRVLRDRLSLSRWQLLSSQTPIQPVVVGDPREAVALSRALEARGFWAPAIRPPTVPAGTARLRISLSAAHEEADVARLAEELNELERQSGN